jgi:hypothetical protein
MPVRTDETPKECPNLIESAREIFQAFFLLNHVQAVSGAKSDCLIMRPGIPQKSNVQPRGNPQLQRAFHH